MRMVAIYGDSSPAVILRVQFDLGDSRIRADQKEALAALAEFIRIERTSPDDPRPVHVQIEGHADATEKNPQALSQLRAKQTRDELVNLGVPPEQLSIHPYSKQRPLVPSDTAEHRRINCRVSFQIGAPD
jgi:chemotaxis protein MotB